MKSLQPIPADPGGTRDPTPGLQQGAATARAQRSLLQLLARIVAKSWIETHGQRVDTARGDSSLERLPATREASDGAVE